MLPPWGHCADGTCRAVAYIEWPARKCPSSTTNARNLLANIQYASSPKMSTYLAQIATVALLAGKVAANSALEYNTNTQNGKTVQIAITVQGSDFYYAICAIMGATCIGILAAAQMKPRTDRVFFYLCASITMVATIAYYAMGSNLGWTPIDVEFPRTDPVVRGRNREIFYARYIDWVITTPLLLTDLLLTAGMPWPSIVWTVLLDELMVVTGLIGALTKSRYKWGKSQVGKHERQPKSDHY
ncbi:hypothetical protein AC579_258 [Pseudocercospora musae]|uniref:Uncharacterized protein n=1 Tax=Pseudocercospora musae TaxID=113226 RepID=A0A139I3P9_9PEZI|nr:hypothetical protein AC579_258 [Pseudocercospora musae]